MTSQNYRPYDEQDIAAIVKALRKDVAGAPTPPPPPLPPNTTALTADVARYRADEIVSRATFLSERGIFTRPTVQSQLEYEMERAVYSLMRGGPSSRLDDVDNLLAAGLALRSLVATH